MNLVKFGGGFYFGDEKGNLHQTCIARAQEFQADTTGRGKELKTLAQVKQVIQETTGTAASFFQVGRLRTSVASSEDLATLKPCAWYVISLAVCVPASWHSLLLAWHL